MTDGVVVTSLPQAAALPHTATINIAWAMPDAISDPFRTSRIHHYTCT
jgi:hypothetical protein